MAQKAAVGSEACLTGYTRGGIAWKGRVPLAAEQDQGTVGTRVIVILVGMDDLMVQAVEGRQNVLVRAQHTLQLDSILVGTETQFGMDVLLGMM